MKRFSFSLQKLLDLRTFREKEAELALGKANSEREAIKLELDEVAHKRVNASYDRKSTMPIQDLLAIENYINRLDIKKEKLLVDLAKAELVFEEARKRYMKATQERQVISKLREKKEYAWHKEYLDAEADILDDMPNARTPADI